MDDENGKSRKRKGPCHATESSGFDLDQPMGFALKKIGAGLANLGNTCFLNSVLQCLTYTEPLAAYLQSGRHKNACRASGFCAMCAIQNHVMNALSSSGKILAPSYLVKNLRSISRSFRLSRQEDAHEYMVMLMESMHRCSLPSGIVSESPSAYEKSLVHKIFGGRLRSQVKCRQCSHCSNTYEPFLDLSLDISQSDSLLKMLSHFTAVEELGGGEKVYQCEQCEVKVQAVKQFTVDKVPHVLAIHLKRFSPTGGKINKKVEFGRTLNMEPFVSGQQEGNVNYTLYGVLVHAGWSTDYGHYFCFIRTSTGNWHALDDNRVYRVSEQDVLEQRAYMLFYVRDKQTTNQPSLNSKYQGIEFKHNKSTSLNATITKKSQSSLNSKCQGNELKHDKSSSLNATITKESHLSGHLVQSIAKIPSCLNSNGTTISLNEDAVLRKANMLDDHSACKVAEIRQSKELESSNSNQCVSIRSLSKLPVVSNSVMLESDGVLQDTAIVVNSCTDDHVTSGDCDTGKDLVNDIADHGEKTSTYLGKAIADDQHEIMKSLGNNGMIEHAHGSERSDVENVNNGDKLVAADAKLPQVTKIPREVRSSHRMTVGEGNDAQASTPGDVLNHGNSSASIVKEKIDRVSFKDIENLDLSKMVKEGNSSLQKQDSSRHLHEKRLKFQRLVGYSNFTILSKRFLLQTAFGISRKKRSFKMKKRTNLKYDNLLCSTSSDRSVKFATGSALLQQTIVKRASESNVQHTVSNENCFHNSCGLKENLESMLLSAQNGSVFTKQMCLQKGFCKGRNLKHNVEQLSSVPSVGGSNDQAFNCDVDGCEQSPQIFCVNSVNLKFQDECDQQRETVHKNAILNKISLESDRVEIDRSPYEKEKEGPVCYTMDGWAEECSSIKSKKPKTRR